MILGGGLGWGGRNTLDPVPTPEIQVVVVTAVPTETAAPTDTPQPTETSEPTLAPTETIVTTAITQETPTPTATPDPFVLPISTTLGMTWTRPLDGMEMLFVPDDTFMMGSTDEDTDAEDNEKPAHEVALDAFWLDSTEVTNAQYVAFLNEMGNQEEEGVTWLDSADDDVRIEEIDGVFQAQDGFADHPVVEVSWYGAQAYCNWVGTDVISTTLPTEAQWEYAARGSTATIYPWGDEFDGTLLNYSGNNDFDRTAPVGSFPDGASWVGALDMAGNVWEWTADWYDANYYEDSPTENPIGPDEGTYKVLRGGSWYNSQPFVRSASRNYYTPDFTNSDFGYRCVAPPG